MTGGLVSIAVLLFLMSLAGFGTTLWYLRVLMFVLGLSVAHVMVPSQASVFATVSPESTGRASGFFNAGRQLGSALGVAVLTTVLAAVGATHRVGGFARPDLEGYHVAFRAAGGLALVGAAVAALLIRDADAAPTMRVAGGKADHVADEEADLVPEDRVLVVVGATGSDHDELSADGVSSNGLVADGVSFDGVGADDGLSSTDRAVRAVRAEGKPAGS
jgi:MFS family permease